ncbi:MAG: class I SAM-dependent methyltransferase [Deltaproteobacteria bacterium]|nr:class I SAM-dependent methyltransferase [Deltaproteobacteria bacterium]
MLGWVALYTACAYVADVLIRPAEVAGKMQPGGKPVLNVGCGTEGSSLRVALFGPTDWGDINCDLEASGACDIRSREPCHCDVHRLPFPDKFFGAAIASHVIEHVSDPHGAMRELARVSDRIYVIVPRWWAPHTWLHPGHQYYVSATQVTPLWKGN